MADELAGLARQMSEPEKPGSRELLELGRDLKRRETASQKADRVLRIIGALITRPGASGLAGAIEQATGAVPEKPGPIESIPSVPAAVTGDVQSLLQGSLEGAAKRDLALAKQGDREAAKRVSARQLAVGAITSVPAVRAATIPGRILAGAALGAGGSAAVAKIGGEPVLPAAGSGALLGAILGPVFGAAARGGRAIRTVEDVSRETFAENPALGRVIQAVNEAPPLQVAQKALYKTARGQRIQAAREAAKGLKGEAAVAATLRQFKGELPKLPGQHFRSVAGQISDVDRELLIEQIRNAPGLKFMESQARGPLALNKILNGQIPQPNELKLLDRVFGPQLSEAVISKQPLSLGQKLLEVPGSIRALRSGYDLSAPFRQGYFLAGRRQFYSSFGTMFRVLRSEKAYQALERDIATRPNAGLYQKSGLAITRAGEQIGQREEAFAGRLLQRLPGLRASERAYTGFLNKIRADVFDDMLRRADKLGIDRNEAAAAISNYVNDATGRGRLPGNLENSAAALASVFWSPRLMASRVNLLNPVRYAQALSPGASPAQRFVAREAIRDLLTVGAAATTVLGLAKAGGAKTSADPRNADFGKIGVGQHRLDVLGGFGQWVRLGARLATQKDRIKQLGRFARYKESPVAALVHNILSGTRPDGTKVTLGREAKSLLTPLIVEDILAAVQHLDSPVGMAFSALGGLGFGYQKYGQGRGLSEREKALEALSQ